MKKLLSNNAALIAIIAAIVLGISVFLVVAMLPKQKPDVASTYLHQSATFTIKVPVGMEAKKSGATVIFTTPLPEGEAIDDVGAGVGRVGDVFGLQVNCSPRKAGDDAIAKYDERAAEGDMTIGNYAVTRSREGEIASRPARYAEYENTAHQVINALTQSDATTCILIAYVPKNNAAQKRPLADQFIQSLKILR